MLDTFDWYSPEYQSHHRYPEIGQWYADCGFEPMTPAEPPVAMLGVKRLGSGTSDGIG